MTVTADATLPSDCSRLAAPTTTSSSTAAADATARLVWASSVASSGKGGRSSTST